jgi:XTP/dITP diphosphohydrolase
VVVATSNPGKLLEIRAILADLPLELVSLDEYAPIDFPEEGSDYASNARVKARAVASQLSAWAVADDSGLEVEALGGEPGPHSARYGGAGLDDRARVSKLLEALEAAAPRVEQRAARFVCEAALATPAGHEIAVRGECRGRILAAPRGGGGFGYDPVFQLEGREETMAELAAAEKNRLSHRARAFRKLGSAILEHHAAISEPA